MIAAHADTADGVDEHNHASPAQHSAFEIRLVLPCQFHGCEHSSLPHDDSDHSQHIASIDFGALSKSEVDFGPLLQRLTLMATDCHPSLLLDFGTNRVSLTHLADDNNAPALRLRANLQVFLI